MVLIKAEGARGRSAWSECVATCSGNSTVTRTRSATAVCTAVLIQQQEQTCGASQCNAAITGIRLCIVQNDSWYLEWLSVSTSACLNRLIDIANMVMRHYENRLDSRLKLFGAGQLSLNGVSPSQFEATDDTGESPLKQALTSAMASTMGTCMRSKGYRKVYRQSREVLGDRACCRCSSIRSGVSSPAR